MINAFHVERNANEQTEEKRESGEEDDGRIGGARIFFEGGGNYGNPSERSERALKGSWLTGE